MSGGILDRLDAAIDGLCPCGAPPRDGSAYCSDDCTPTHHAAHTTSHVDGTPMRWRPDLVTAADDSDLTLIEQRRRGRLNATTYCRRGGAVMHLRLDDGNRFVGADINMSTTGGYDGTPPFEHPAWGRLERELNDNRRTVPDPCYDHDGDPWPELARAAAGTVHVGPAGGTGSWRELGTVAEPRPHTVSWQRRCLHCGERGAPLPGVRALLTRVDIMNFGSFEPTRVVDDREHCDMCSTCRREFPGPSLEVTRTEEQDMLTGGTLTKWRMRIGDRKAGWACTGEFLRRHRNPQDVIRQHLERLEQQLVMDYARSHPDRPDIIDWAEAYRSASARNMRQQMEQLGTLDFSAFTSSLRRLGLTMAPPIEQLRQINADAEPEPEPDHPLARMNARRRNASHGPQAPQRPPRQLRPNGR